MRVRPNGSVSDRRLEGPSIRILRRHSIAAGRLSCSSALDIVARIQLTIYAIRALGSVCMLTISSSVAIGPIWRFLWRTE